MEKRDIKFYSFQKMNMNFTFMKLKAKYQQKGNSNNMHCANRG